MKQHPGFLSPTGIVAAVVVLAAALVLTFVATPSLYSPGSLNAQAKGSPLKGVPTHAQLAHDCGACHTAPWSSQTMADKCLACHADVQTQIATKQGIHSKMVPAASPTCRGCHPEHNGPHGALTSLNEATFPHQLTGYSLSDHRRTAKGAPFTCADCHPKGIMTFDQAICADCHGAMDASFMQQHEATFGKDCLPCHNGNGGAKVDHSKFAFKLTGAHAGLPCNDCHAGAKSLADHQKTPQDCYSCHAKDDHHKGAFGTQCGQCHSTSSWSGATFDHSIFPVNHGGGGSCPTCHPNGTSTYTCFGCHAHTQANVVSEHEGRSLAQLTDCIKCHAGGSSGGD
jgi:hypothetical protein